MMKSQDGVPSLPVWLIGDSNPLRWEDQLQFPLDARHPARHSIWTPVFDAMQDRVYRLGSKRIDDSRFFIRNAVQSVNSKPVDNLKDWPECLLEMVRDLQQSAYHNRPRLILSFGAFSFEFCRRALGEDAKYNFKYWTTERMGQEFRQRTRNDQHNDKTLLLPLLHASIARRHFIKSHEAFCGYKDANYFTHVGAMLGDWFYRHGDSLKIWIAP